MNINEPIIRHKLSVGDYYRMGEAGILHAGEKIELIEGELIDMAPIGSHHASTVAKLTRLIFKAVSDEVIVYTQSPLRLSDWSEPQPDIMLLKPRADEYFDSHPEPSDVLVLIEVADSSIHYDRKTKLGLYARYGILEVWLVDLNTKQVERYSRPAETGYGYLETFDKHQSLSPNYLPDVTIDLAQVFA